MWVPHVHVMMLLVRLGMVLRGIMCKARPRRACAASRPAMVLHALAGRVRTRHWPRAVIRSASGKRDAHVGSALVVADTACDFAFGLQKILLPKELKLFT